MAYRARSLTAPFQRWPLPGVVGRLLAAALALVGIAVVAMNPGNIALALGTGVVTAVALCLIMPPPAKLEGTVPEQIVEEHKLLRECIEGSPIPFAVYDRDDYLIASNESYEKLYGDTFDMLRKQHGRRRIRYADLVRGFAAGSVPDDKIDAYVEERCRKQRNADGTGVDRHYSGFGWVRVTKFATPGGAVAGFAVDINELKRRETALQAQIEHGKMLEDKLRTLANTDPLTELANRRAFFERLETEFVRSNRYGDPLSVVMMDIDLFKSINDTYGHSFGDSVITRLASAAAAELRARVDLIGRLGGEEFGILLPATGVEGALECAKRICRSIAGLDFETDSGKIRITASFGVSAVMPTDPSHSACMTRADRALYRAKADGRDRVVLWDETLDDEKSRSR